MLLHQDLLIPGGHVLGPELLQEHGPLELVLVGVVRPLLQVGEEVELHVLVLLLEVRQHKALFVVPLAVQAVEVARVVKPGHNHRLHLTDWILH